MSSWISECEDWLRARYQRLLGERSSAAVSITRAASEHLLREPRNDGTEALVIRDVDIGLVQFVIHYQPDALQRQVSQAIGIRSQLLRESNYTGFPTAGEHEDGDGSWRVALLWLVDDESWHLWQRQVLELRRESGAAEEISLDAIRVGTGQLLDALESHGLSRLLLQTRSLFSHSKEEGEAWLSADAQVSAALSGFAGRFPEGRARVFAHALEERVSTQPAAVRTSSDAPTRHLTRFEVRNFRNLTSLDLALDQGASTEAQAVILFGPNGTGKSSLAEAVSLAAFGNSPRMERFLADPDVRSRTLGDYIRDYVTPMPGRSSSDVVPSFSWNDAQAQNFTSIAADGGRHFDGVVLNQEDSTDFTKHSREQLALYVLKGYSGLADSVSSWIADEERRSADTKHSFTRKHGLNNAIRLSATAYSRLAQQLLSRQLQRPSTEFVEWLKFVEQLATPEAGEASQLLVDWRLNGIDTVVSRLSEALAKLQERGNSDDDIVAAIHEALTAYDALARRSADIRDRFARRTTELREALDLALEQIAAWGAWLELQSNSSPIRADQDHLNGVRKELEELAKARAHIEDRGKRLRSRLDVLDRAHMFIATQWGDEHSNECPVCESDLEARGGAKEVVQTIQAASSELIQELRIQHAQLQSQQRDLEQKLKVRGADVCPVAEGDRLRLQALVSAFIGSGETLISSLSDPSRRSNLLASLARMRSLVTVPEPYSDADIEAARIADEFSALCREADRALEDPQAVAEVKKQFEAAMESVLKVHLPSTLGAVWGEITLALTSAPWLLPEMPTMKVEQRGRSLSIRAGHSNLLARYLFNAAERHILGLGWFFTNYISRRCFDESWMLLDDPAGEMDQPSYREFVRFAETLLRLFKRANRRLTMVLALHQEDRALDAARATNGQMYALGWSRDQSSVGDNSSVQKVMLLAPGFHPIRPSVLFAES